MPQCVSPIGTIHPVIALAVSMSSSTQQGRTVHVAWLDASLISPFVSFSYVHMHVIQVQVHSDASSSLSSSR